MEVQELFTLFMVSGTLGCVAIVASVIRDFLELGVRKGHFPPPRPSGEGVGVTAPLRPKQPRNMGVQRLSPMDMTNDLEDFREQRLVLAKAKQHEAMVGHVSKN